MAVFAFEIRRFFTPVKMIDQRTFRKGEQEAFFRGTAQPEAREIRPFAPAGRIFSRNLNSPADLGFLLDCPYFDGGAAQPAAVEVFDFKSVLLPVEGHIREIRTVKPDRIPDEVP